jgi:hypothetical protein
MSLKSSTIIGGAGAEKRRELDFYPTPAECTHALMKYLNLNIEEHIIWEPACGTGEMSEVLKRYASEVISTDLRYTGYGEGGVEYLTTTKRPCTAIITNPPFNLADKFILRAVNEANVVAMLLKSQYWHAKKRLNLFTLYKPSAILPLTWRPDFTKGGEGSPTMDMIWTVWDSRSGSQFCNYQPLIKPINPFTGG